MPRKKNVDATILPNTESQDPPADIIIPATQLPETEVEEKPEFESLEKAGFLVPSSVWEIRNQNG